MKNTNIIQINGEDIVVDQECAEMVLFFNEVGLKTRMCCQGHEKPIFRIWFNVEDEIVKDFIEKTAQWTEVFIRKANDEGTEFETYRAPRGLRGWIYKRYWWPKGEYQREEWVYQSEGESNLDAIQNAKYDLLCMKAMYFGTNLKEIQRSQQTAADKTIKKIIENLRKGS